MSNALAETDSRQTGLEEVVRSLRTLTRSGRELIGDGGDVLERELAMAISLSEGVRDNVIATSALEDARTAGGIHSRLRADAHRVVDLVADFGSVAAESAIRFVEQFAAEPLNTRAERA